MSRGVMTFQEGWDELLYQHANGKPQPKKKPERLPAAKIKRWEAVFQHRKPLESHSAGHVRELAAKAKENKDGLAPITVWWDGKHWACIDGHHRLKAYMLANMREHNVPVTVFEGTPQQAVVEAAQGNTADKLTMSKSEKVRAAWRLVVAEPGITQEALARASGISPRRVSDMVRCLRTLRGMRAKDIADMSWYEARTRAAGQEYAVFEVADDYVEVEARKVAEKMHKHIGPRMAGQVEIFSRALELYSERLSNDLRDYWREHPEEDE